jgi:hypothetical protein
MHLRTCSPVKVLSQLFVSPLVLSIDQAAIGYGYVALGRVKAGYLDHTMYSPW